MSETTTEMLAEIERQAADYTPPEGWRLLQVGEVLEDEDWIIDTRDGNGCPTMKAGSKVGDHQTGEHQIYIRRIEQQPEPQPEPEPELEDCGFEGKISREQPQPVHLQAMIEAQAETIARLHSEINALNMEIAEQQKAVNGTGAVNDSLRLQLEAVKAESAKRLQQVEELRSEVSHVQGLLGEEKRRFAELETLASDLRAVNAATEKAINAAARDKADLQHRLDVVSSEWAVQAETIRGLQAQLEAVKADLAQVSRDRYLLQIELDAREQVPEAVSDRFDQGFEQGTSRAVETIAEWTAPFRTCGSQALAYHVMQNLPHIMRTLTGLADED